MPFGAGAGVGREMGWEVLTLAQTHFLFDGVGMSFPLIQPMERVTGRGEAAWSCIRMRDRKGSLAGEPNNLDSSDQG